MSAGTCFFCTLGENLFVLPRTPPCEKRVASSPLRKPSWLVPPHLASTVPRDWQAAPPTASPDSPPEGLGEASPLRSPGRELPHTAACERECRFPGLGHRPSPICTTLCLCTLPLPSLQNLMKKYILPRQSFQSFLTDKMAVFLHYYQPFKTYAGSIEAAVVTS